MKPPSLDKPLKLTPDFLIAFAVLSVPTLWLVQPWCWNLPVVARIAGIVFIPLAAVSVCYCPVLCALAVIYGGKEERKNASAFIGAIAGAVVFLSLVWILYGFDRLPSLVAIPAVLIASAIYSRRKPSRPII
jgi:hypothetical protein